MYTDTKQKIFFIRMLKRETATNHTPVYTFGLGTPPRQKQIYSQIKT